MPKPTQAQKALQQNPAYIEIIATGNNTSKPGKQSFYVVKEIAKISQVFESAIRKMEENNVTVISSRSTEDKWNSHKTSGPYINSRRSQISGNASRLAQPFDRTQNCAFKL